MVACVHFDTWCAHGSCAALLPFPPNGPADPFLCINLVGPDPRLPHFLQGPLSPELEAISPAVGSPHVDHSDALFQVHVLTPAFRAVRLHAAGHRHLVPSSHLILPHTFATKATTAAPPEHMRCAHHCANRVPLLPDLILTSLQ